MEEENTEKIIVDTSSDSDYAEELSLLYERQSRRYCKNLDRIDEVE